MTINNWGISIMALLSLATDNIALLEENYLKQVNLLKEDLGEDSEAFNLSKDYLEWLKNSSTQEDPRYLIMKSHLKNAEDYLNKLISDKTPHSNRVIGFNVKVIQVLGICNSSNEPNEYNVIFGKDCYNDKLRPSDAVEFSFLALGFKFDVYNFT